jgi:hypothetical protein
MGLHLRFMAENIGEEKRWSLRRTILSIFGASLVLWLAGLLVFRFLLGP